MPLFLVGCGGSDSAQCPLNCSNAINASGSEAFSLRWKNDTISYNCSANQQGRDLTPIRLQFQLLSNDGDNVPGSFIRFDPKASGLRSIDAAEAAGNVSLIEGTSDEYDAPEYFGVATPQDEWCTDACGIGTINFVPRCPANGESGDVSMRISSGTFFPDNGEGTWTSTVTTISNTSN